MVKRGTTIRRLEDRLIEALADRYGPDVRVGVIIESIVGVEGFWRRMEVRRWYGVVTVNRVEIQVSSWSTMTECVRYGVTLRLDTEVGLRYTDFTGFDAVIIE